MSKTLNFQNEGVNMWNISHTLHAHVPKIKISTKNAFQHFTHLNISTFSTCLPLPPRPCAVVEQQRVVLQLGAYTYTSTSTYICVYISAGILNRSPLKAGIHFRVFLPGGPSDNSPNMTPCSNLSPIREGRQLGSLV